MCVFLRRSISFWCGFRGNVCRAQWQCLTDHSFALSSCNHSNELWSQKCHMWCFFRNLWCVQQGAALVTMCRGTPAASMSQLLWQSWILFFFFGVFSISLWPRKTLHRAWNTVLASFSSTLCFCWSTLVQFPWAHQSPERSPRISDLCVFQWALGGCALSCLASPSTVRKRLRLGSQAAWVLKST